MFWRIARSRGIIPLVLILVAFGYWRLHSRRPQYIAVEHVGERSVTLWNSLAQVRQPIGDLHYGDRVEVVREVLTGVSQWQLSVPLPVNWDGCLIPGR